MFNLEKYKEKIDAFSGIVLKAYLDSAIFMTILELANDEHRINNFLFDYSYYTIRGRAIISAKSLIEPSGKDKLTLDTIIKKLVQNKKHKEFADELHKEYKELLDSEGAKRVKDFRDSLCHNIEDDSERMLYCNDIKAIINTTMNILQDIYQEVFYTANEDFFKIEYLALTLADDYWHGICEQADKAPSRQKELIELQRMLSGGK